MESTPPHFPHLHGEEDEDEEDEEEEEETRSNAAATTAAHPGRNKKLGNRELKQYADKMVRTYRVLEPTSTAETGSAAMMILPPFVMPAGMPCPGLPSAPDAKEALRVREKIQRLVKDG